LNLRADRAKAGQLTAKLNELSFPELLDFYCTSSVVTPQQAHRYKRGVLADVARSDAARLAWENAAAYSSGLSILDIVCETAPLWVAAGPQYKRVAGVDIALRWLVLGKKRLADAGPDVCKPGAEDALSQSRLEVCLPF
jgi:hypothetical protein